MLCIIRRISLISAIFVLLGIFQIIILCVPFRIYSRRLTYNLPNGLSDKHKQIQDKLDYLSRQQLGYAILIGRMVAAISPYTPWPNKCLVQALVCKFLLRRFKIANTLVIGVGFEPNGQFKAHAWVTIVCVQLNQAADRPQDSSTIIRHEQSLTIVGGANSSQEFKTIKTFSDTYACISI